MWGESYFKITNFYLLCFIKHRYNAVRRSTSEGWPRCFHHVTGQVQKEVGGEGKGIWKGVEAEKGGSQRRTERERREEEAGLEHTGKRENKR